MDSPDLDYDELLSALSTVTFQLHRTRKALEEAEQRTLEMKRVFDNIERVLDGAEVPQLHVVNRIEWLRDKAQKRDA